MDIIKYIEKERKIFQTYFSVMYDKISRNNVEQFPEVMNTINQNLT